MAHTIDLATQAGSTAYSHLIVFLWKLEVIRIDVLGIANQPSIWRTGLNSSADSK